MPVKSVPQPNDLPSDFVAAHKGVLADKALQFKLGPLPHYQPPEWLKWFEPAGRAIGWFLRTFGPAGLYLFWGLVALVLGVVLIFILNQLGYVRVLRRKAKADPQDDQWLTHEEPARKLLAEADALAATGHYEAAAHLLLLRTFEDISARRPKLLTPAVTSREMTRSVGIPENARTMFAVIARHVEASLFGGSTLEVSGWEECRAAYTRFARPGDWL